MSQVPDGTQIDAAKQEPKDSMLETDLNRLLDADTQEATDMDLFKVPCADSLFSNNVGRNRTGNPFQPLNRKS